LALSAAEPTVSPTLPAAVPTVSPTPLSMPVTPLLDCLDAGLRARVLREPLERERVDFVELPRERELLLARRGDVLLRRAIVVPARRVAWAIATHLPRVSLPPALG
jgi:hypothetical protein